MKRIFSRHRLWLALMAAFVLAPEPIWGDDVRPVQVQVREQEPGLFLVQWQVPQVMQPQAMPTPRMPDSCSPDGERTVRAQPGAWLNRQVFRCPDGISGQSIGIAYPFGNPALSTVLRVESLSGERHATLLAPGEDSWQVPAAPEVDAPLWAAQSAVLDGVSHVFQHGVHLAFLAAIAVLGSVALITRFAFGQLAAVVLATVGLRIGLPLGELGLAVATVLLANQALCPEEERKQLGPLAAAAGIVHGLGWASTLGGGAPMFFAVLGMDVTLLVLAAALVKIVSATVRYRRAWVYATGVGAVALGLGLWVSDPSAEARNPSPAGPVMPGLSGGASGGTAQASRRVSPQTSDAAIQSFIAIEAFDVRHEVLVRLRDVAASVGLGGVDAVEVEDQNEIKRRVAEFVAANHALEIAGVVAGDPLERVDFMTVDAQGVLPRPTPVEETVEAAFIGVTVEQLTSSTARRVDLSWDAFEITAEVPATVTDPEVSRAVLLTRDAPALRWENVLAEDPVPTVAAVAVQPLRVPVPLLSIPLLAAALVLVGAGLRGRTPSRSFALARVALVLALVVGPIGDVAVALPYSRAPTEAQARRVLAGVLPNVYRAFEFREESAAYDRLAVSITGETLTDIYLEHRRALEMEERGGARARVEAVEVLGVPSVVSGASGGFDAEASWSVSGTVTHFGHRHFRQNRYEALVVVVPVEGSWKIRSVDVLDEERVQ